MPKLKQVRCTITFFSHFSLIVRWLSKNIVTTRIKAQFFVHTNVLLILEGVLAKKIIARPEKIGPPQNVRHIHRETKRLPLKI